MDGWCSVPVRILRKLVSSKNPRQKRGFFYVRPAGRTGLACIKRGAFLWNSVTEDLPLPLPFSINLEKETAICYPYLPMKTYAALDIGSNTFRLLIAKADKTLQPLLMRRVVTRLGSGVAQTGRINPEAISRSLSCLKSFSMDMIEHEVQTYRATGTAALRRAGNARSFTSKVQEECGILIEIIPWEEEAQLTLTGVLGAITGNNGTRLVFDIGGGSTEFMLCEDSRLMDIKSIDLGVVSLTEQFFRGEDPPGEEARRSLTRFIKGELESLVSVLKTSTNDIAVLIGTAGTVTTLAAMLQRLEKYDPLRINNYVINEATLHALYAEMVALPFKDRARLPGLEPGRADVIVAGAMLVLEIMKMFRFEQLTAIDAGLLEGIIYNLVPSLIDLEKL
jgi:exopolyphosphatase / guanosine-5'-triphosphate,3'-diphosphate pyrophosphatase